MQVVFFQTADAFRYDAMLRATSRTVIEFCRRSGCLYESFTGLKRGFWPWQATFNRIVQFDELVRRGFRGWAAYLDADAYIADLDFDIHSYLQDKSGYAAIVASARATEHAWDVNAGVCFVNTAHPVGRDLIAEWNRRFAALTDERLRDAPTWLEAENDQAFLQNMLQTDPALLAATFIASNELMNSSYASFVRQHLRQYTSDLETRVRAITESTDAIMARALADTGPEPSARVADDPRLADEAVAALYRGVLRREPDPEGRHRAIAGLQTIGFENGLHQLVASLLNSAEYAALRAL